MKAGDGKPRSDSRRRTGQIAFRVTQEELAAVAEAAANDSYDAQTGLWARHVVMDEAGLPGRAQRVLPDLIREMRKIGVNINQIARVANRAGQLDHEARLHQCMAELTDTMVRAALAQR